MTSLDRKLWRDLWHLRGQVSAIAMVVACGVVTVVTSRVAYQSLAASQSDYYAQYRFGDAFVSLKRAPGHVADAIQAIPGIESIETRLLYEVTIQIPGMIEPASARLTSLPERRRPSLNDVYLRRGRYLRPGAPEEVLVNEAFADANRLDIGSRFAAVLNGRWTQLEIVGIALSPEYVYAVPRSGVFPDNRRFGIVWMGREAVEAAFDMDGSFNDVVVGLSADAELDPVLASLDRLLEPYGGRDAYGREDHVSDRFLSDEIKQNRQFGTVLPMLFLAVAAFLLNVLLSRLIGMQRDQIGMLKAFGYRHTRVALHYLELAMVGVAAGAVLGTGLGYWLARIINRMYAKLYNFPSLSYVMSPDTVALAVLCCTAAALAGAWGAMHRTWAVPAASAMRPEPPARFQAGALERLGMQQWLSPASRMIARNLARRPWRAVLATCGIAFAVALIIMGRFFGDSIEHLALVQFDLVQREDINLTTLEPLSPAARHAIERLPGVTVAESFRAAPVRVRSQHRSRRAVLLGLERSDGMRRLVGSTLQAAPLPPDGALLTAKLAELLEVEPGGYVDLEILEGQRKKRRVVVAGVVDEYIGMWVYMDRKALARTLAEEGSVTGSLLRVDPLQLDRLWTTLREIPAVAGVSTRIAAVESFRETLGENILVFTGVLVGFAVVLAFAVVYNTTRIALSERGRELASLRVLGFTRAEVTKILLGEQILLTALAIPLGYWFGYLVCANLVANFALEVFRIPLIIHSETYLFALAVVGIAGLASAAIVRRRIDHFDLVEVLKTRE